MRAICGPPRSRGVQLATGSSVRGWRRPSTGLARPPPGAFPRSPRAQAECGPSAGSLAVAPPSPRGRGASARIDFAPGEPAGCAAARRGCALATLRSGGAAARIRPPHSSESARSVPGPRGLRRLRLRPRRPIGGHGIHLRFPAPSPSRRRTNTRNLESQGQERRGVRCLQSAVVPDLSHPSPLRSALVSWDEQPT